jgi:hypothetical protein
MIMKKSKSKSGSKELAGNVQATRLRLATAEKRWNAAKEQARLAKRRRKQAKQAARHAKKQARLAKRDLAEAKRALAEAEEKLAQAQSATRTKSKKRPPAKSQAVKRKPVSKGAAESPAAKLAISRTLTAPEPSATVANETISEPRDVAGL